MIHKSLLRPSLTPEELKEYKKKIEMENKMRILKKKGSRTIRKKRTFTCRRGCCDVVINPFQWKSEWEDTKHRTSKTAGIFIYDMDRKTILLVQSCGRLWGAPKGGVHKGETFPEAAIREVKEETGLDIDIKLIQNQKPIYLKKRTYYYILNMPQCDVEVQEGKYNDANGITWIHIDCIRTLCNKKGEYRINKHAKTLIGQIFNRDLSNKFYSCPVLHRIGDGNKGIIVEDKVKRCIIDRELSQWKEEIKGKEEVKGGEGEND